MIIFSLPTSNGMIYLFIGENQIEVSKKASALFDSLKQKKPDASFLVFDSENVSQVSFAELTLSRGLFENKIVVFLKDIFENEEKSEEFLKIIKEVAKSETIFVVSAGKLTKDKSEKLKKNSEKVFEGKEIQKKKEKINVFDLADAFGRRDKKRLWKLLLEVKGKVPAEEIHGILWWQVKTIVLVSKTKSANEAGVSPFPYGKAKEFLRNYSQKELENFLILFPEIYHEAHRGSYDLYDKLEEIVLGL